MWVSFNQARQRGTLVVSNNLLPTNQPADNLPQSSELDHWEDEEKEASAAARTPKGHRAQEATNANDDKHYIY
jgi:hypothetical protein